MLWFELKLIVCHDEERPLAWICRNNWKKKKNKKVFVRSPQCPSSYCMCTYTGDSLAFANKNSQTISCEYLIGTQTQHFPYIHGKLSHFNAIDWLYVSRKSRNTSLDTFISSGMIYCTYIFWNKLSFWVSYLIRPIRRQCCSFECDTSYRNEFLCGPHIEAALRSGHEKIYSVHFTRFYTLRSTHHQRKRSIRRQLSVCMMIMLTLPSSVRWFSYHQFESGQVEEAQGRTNE